MSTETPTASKTYVTPAILLDYVQKRFTPQDLHLVKQACTFVETRYGEVVHPTGKPYIQYVYGVAKSLFELGTDAVVVSAALVYPPPALAEKILVELRGTFTEELIKLVAEACSLVLQM